MKMLDFNKLIIVLFAMTISASCIEDDEFDTPDTSVIEPELETEPINLNSMFSIYEQALFAEADDLGIDPNDEAAIHALKQTFIFSFDVDNTLYTEGYVISVDEAGNFFEELLLQNEASNPSIGVKVLIDVNPLFTTFEFGRKTFIRLDGLSLGYENGVLTLGVREGNSIEKITSSQMNKYLIRDIEVAEIVAMPIGISEFSIDKTNLFIRLTEVQFNRNDVLGENRKTFAAEPEDEFDGERILESCTNGLSTIFSTSTFADFKALLLPQGKGSIEGILTLNFFGEEFNIVVNSPTSINLDNPDRCDPTEIDCGIAATTGTNEMFSDFFETQTVGDLISGNGWTNYIEAGTAQWEAYFDDGTNASLGISARVGSFMSGDTSSIAWLITPQFNFDTQNGETLNFKTSNSFSDGSTLELLFSNDWDGNPNSITSATWDLLISATIVNDDDFFGDWIASGNVNLDCITGTGHIALKYVGSGDKGFDGTYEFDEIVINSN